MRLSRPAAGALAGVAASALLIGTAFAASNNIIVTYAGNGQSGYSGDGGPSTAAKLDFPSGIVLDNAANIFFDDTVNHRVRKVNASQVITTVAGTGQSGFSGDGGPATAAKFNYPAGVTITGGGVLYIADSGNNRVRKVATNGVVTTVAGNGSAGYAGDGGPGPSAKLTTPTGLALDGSGNLYIADTGNNVVRKLATNGTITTYAGKYWSGNNNHQDNGNDCQLTGNTGPATSAMLCAPTGLAVSGSNLLISDTGNNQVRKVNGGTITAFAGTGSGGFSGDGGQATSAKVKWPVGVAYDPLGNVYVVDSGNARIRQVNASGVISTFGGTGSPGFSGDSGPAELAKISTAGGVTTDASNVFFSDTFNQRVRRIHKGGPPPALPEAANVIMAGSAIALLGGGAFVMTRRRRRGAPQVA
jgi:hypothetical protein